MPLLLTQEDLSPLFEKADLLERGFQAVEKAILGFREGSAGRVSYSQFDLEPDRAECIYTSATSHLVVRLFPSIGRGAPAPNCQMMMMLDATTGSLLAFLSGDDLNTARTALPAALGARYLAPANAKALCVLGSSAQARGAARLISHAVPSIESVRVWSPNPEHREACARDLSQAIGKQVHAPATAEEAVVGADIVAPAGFVAPGQAAYEAAWLKPGALHVSITRSAPAGLKARVYFPTLKRPQALVGQVPSMRPGTPPPAFPMPPMPPAQPPYDAPPSDLGEVIAGASPARTSPDETLVWEIAAMYAWESAIASWAFDWAREAHAGQDFELTSAGRGAFPAW